jgi:hypothetical protein
MSSNKTSFIASFWFTATMSVVAIVVLAEKLIMFNSGDLRNLIGIPIWILIAYHFITVTYQSWKQTSRQV